MEMNLNKLQDVVKDTEVWSAAVYGVLKSQKRFNYWTTTLIFRELLWLFWVQATHNGRTWDFPGGPVDTNLPASAGDTGSILGPGRFHMPRTN